MELALAAHPGRCCGPLAQWVAAVTCCATARTMTPVNFADLIAAASKNRDGWNAQRALQCAQSLSDAVDSSLRVKVRWVDWDDGAGENWARVLWDNDVVAVVAMPLPLALVSERIGESPGTEALTGVVVSRFAEWGRPLYTIGSVDAALRAFAMPAWPDVDLDAPVSPWDIWWATV